MGETRHISPGRQACRFLGRKAWRCLLEAYIFYRPESGGSRLSFKRRHPILVSYLLQVRYIRFAIVLATGPDGYSLRLYCQNCYCRSEREHPTVTTYSHCHLFFQCCYGFLENPSDLCGPRLPSDCRAYHVFDAITFRRQPGRSSSTRIRRRREGAVREYADPAPDTTCGAGWCEGRKIHRYVLSGYITDT